MAFCLRSQRRDRARRRVACRSRAAEPRRALWSITRLKEHFTSPSPKDPRPVRKHLHRRAAQSRHAGAV